ncbi:MAG: hypothetical protein BalsKO_05820 [Balneolaceae bacterium]
MRVFLLALLICLPTVAEAQISSVNGNLMGEFVNYEQNLIPNEDSEAFILPDPLQLKQWKRMMDLFVAESYAQAEDSLSTNFSNYEMVLLTDTSFINREYYLIREKNPPTLGWGLFASDPDYQRDAIIAVPHPLYDSFTPQQGVNMFQYLGSRLLAMAGTHRCSNDEASFSDGTTKVCSDTDTSEKYKVSDMAHYDSTAFQIAHESIKELSTNVYAINLHGHANSSCEDVFLSNGRDDDAQTSLQTVRDSLIAFGVNAAMTGDGSSCTLAGTTNVQGRFINGSTNPADDQPANNTGFFFHVEQSQIIRRSLGGHKTVIDAFSKLIPRSFTTVTIPDYPSLTINELHSKPDPANGDANNNGSVGSVSDEFLEIVNTADTTISLDHWIISDNVSDRHVVESGTNLLPGQPLLIFGQNSYTGDFGGSIVQPASTNALSLNDTGDKISIKTPANDIITFVEYSGDVTNESITLNPDITGDSLVAHSVADSDDNSLFSPGTKINGNSFLPFIEISGDPGWRMMTVPTTKMPIQDLISVTPIQGFGDGHTKNFYTNWSGSEWESPNSLSDSLENGRGFILYFYDNNNAESKELPLTVRGTGTIPSSDVTIDLHTNGDKWNLIGNPFNKAINFGSITVNGGELVSNIGQIYDPATQSYKTTTSIGDSVSAWQGIMIQDSTASSITIPFSSIIDSASFLKDQSSSKSYLVLSAIDKDSKLEDQLVLYFSEDSNLDWDINDAEELPPLSSTSISFSGIGYRGGKEIIQTQVSLPEDVSGLGELEIPLLIRTLKADNQIQLRIDKKVNIPEYFSLKIESKNSQESHNFLENPTFEIDLNNHNENDFKLIIGSSQITPNDNESLKPRVFSISQNYPNPFNPNTIIKYQLPENSFVSLKVYTINGALVSTLVNELQSPGEYSTNFDGSTLSSGIYFYSISSSFGTITKKMILLK